MTHINRYHDRARTTALVNDGRHRELVGGRWDEIGRLQFEFIRDRGLRSDMYLLDVGCGCLRGGVHFVAYLDAGHYFGIELQRELLDAGYDQELAAAGLQGKLPRTNLACTGEFEAEQFGVEFDVALAQSVFTHLPLNHIRACLIRIARVVRPGGVFYATVFLSPDTHDWSEPWRHDPGGIMTYPTRDPYHYQARDLAFCAAGLPWGCDIVGDWGHPRGQSMVLFTRTD